MPNIGVVIGRFQVPALTAGHRALLDHVANKHEQVAVLVGTCPRLSKRNPLPFLQVCDALSAHVDEYHPNKFAALPILDGPSNAEWSDRVDALLAATFPGQTFQLYCGRDGFAPCYEGRWDVSEIVSALGPSGSDVRSWTKTENLCSLDYRKGLVAARQFDFDKVYPVIDVAVIRSLNLPGQYEILMGRKRTEEQNAGYRFIGGFVDPTDENLEHTVRREVMEEADIEVGDVRYVSSVRIKDWRYRNTNDSVMSSFFIASYLFGSSKPKDDINELVWVHIRDVKTSTLPIHQPLADALDEYLQKNSYFEV